MSETGLSVVMMGASGAVGGHVVRTLAKEPGLVRLTLLARKPLEIPPHPAIETRLVDVTKPESYRAALPGAQAAVCTLGVGEASKVSREEFVRVDRDLVLGFATACREAGVRHFELLGAVDANPRSRLFYLRIKGELEEGLRALKFERLSLFRPSNIITPTNRYGFTQALVLAIWPHLNPVLPGRWRKYRGIRVETLGAAMAKNLFTPGIGEKVLQWDEFMALAG